MIWGAARWHLRQSGKIEKALLPPWGTVLLLLLLFDDCWECLPSRYVVAKRSLWCDKALLLDILTNW
jgi:hypothetical protein